MTLTPDTSFSLDDRYSLDRGEVLISGIQALVRAPLDQLRADARAGLRTTAFFSGYQGSPLGGFDRELLTHQKLLDQFRAVVRPALNEELGATAVMGSQASSTWEHRTYDGVIGVWYGKGPGLDRAGDAIRHAQFFGSSRHGGALALVGDDPSAKSSTVQSRSEGMMAHLGLPVLFPGTMQDVLDLTRHGILMSRASGLWTGIKITTAVADATGSALVDPERIQAVIPEVAYRGVPFQAVGRRDIFPPTGALEEEVIGARLEMVLAYVTVNRLNRMLADPDDAWLTIIAAGQTAEVVLDTFAGLGIARTDLHGLGIRILKLGAITPLEADLVRRSARGVATVLVVEDKTPYLETLVRDALYPLAERPAVIGKLDRTGSPLVTVPNTQTVEVLTEPLRRVLLERLPADRLAPRRTAVGLHLIPTAEATRTPYFCSGCPHNTGTKAPDDALVGAGIGCHGMITIMPTKGRGTIVGLTQMGGEGSQWIGISPFVSDTHLFQNIGDGTFFHSGQLAVQACNAAGVNITYKLLYNAAVAMTGGQDATGLLGVPAIATKLVAEGAKEVIITTDDPGKYHGVTLPPRTKVWHRDRIVEAQEHLRTVPGVTILIHDQQCAAEKRRDRKRGLLPTPEFRIVIDERVCEGCGDCGVQSNCLSLQPLETEFGRKTVIDQASCNLDTSCVKGDCPAFITVKPSKDAARTKRASAPVDRLTEPNRVVPAAATIRMPGIGGTGVVTVAQVLAAAAKIDGVDAKVLDQTGLSQKAGPVVSTVTIGDAVPGQIDLLLALDLLVAVTPANVVGVSDDVSVVVASTSITPTGRMVGKVATAKVEAARYLMELEGRSRAALNRYADASHLTVGLLGSAVTANVFMLGVAFQAGALPLTAGAIERAIELNGTAVTANIEAFRWGRLHVIDPMAVEAAAGVVHQAPPDVRGLDAFADDAELQRLVAVRRAELVDYQDRKLAGRYVAAVGKAWAAEQAAGGDGSFSRTVAFQLHRVMAYKDEYEVARLLLGSRERVERSFGAVDTMVWNLHPPMLRAMGMQRKLHLGGWSRPALVTLKSMKRVRGTVLDLPGHSKMRRAERELATDYAALVERLTGLLRTDHAKAVEVAGLVDMVRGYEDVKLANLDAYRTALAAAGY